MITKGFGHIVTALARARPEKGLGWAGLVPGSSRSFFFISFSFVVSSSMGGTKYLSKQSCYLPVHYLGEQLRFWNPPCLSFRGSSDPFHLVLFVPAGLAAVATYYYYQTHDSFKGLMGGQFVIH